jgi:hypothetical protein
LANGREQEVRRHLSACPHCRSVFRGLGGSSGDEPAGEGSAPEPTGPRRLGQYELFEQLGRGGMGSVHRARHTRLKRWMALKILPPDRTSDPAAVSRFQREMEAVGQIEHRNVVRATDAGEAEGLHFLVMELIDGGTLSHLVRRCGPLPPAAACELARQAALGLQYVHERGMVHRDVKPSNLMLTSAGEVKILDLGLALLQGGLSGGEELTGLTGVGKMLGTPEYMAPEQWIDGHAVDARADVYGLGCTLYKLLTGKPPFSTLEYPSLGEMMTAHTLAPPRVRGLSGVPEPLGDLLARMLAKRRDDRFATAAAVAVALEPFAQGADLRSLFASASPAAGADERPAGAALTTTHRPGMATLAPTPTAPPPAAVARRRWLAAALAALLVGGLGAGGILLRRTRPWPEGPEDDRPAPDQPPEPGVPNVLLRREPIRLRWPEGSKNTSLMYSPQKRKLLLTCDDLGLLALGETSAPRFVLSVTVHQNPWAGNVGLFFGYRDREANGSPGQSFHVIELCTAGHTGSDRLFRMFWRAVRYDGPAGRQREINETYGASRDTFRIPPSEQCLKVTVGPSGLERVTWGDTVVASLSAAASKPPRMIDARGQFGVYVRSGNGAFRNALYSFDKE